MPLQKILVHPQSTMCETTEPPSPRMARAFRASSGGKNRPARFRIASHSARHTTMASLYTRFGAFYSSSFARRPWLTLAVANGTLGVIADGLAQSLDRREKPITTTTSKSQWDWPRTGRFATFGVVMAPLLAEWNKFIEYRFPLRASAAGKVSLLALSKRVAFDQILLYVW